VASELSLGRLARSLPRIADYVLLTLPQLDAATFAADVAYWYYDFPRWLGLLLDTALIGGIATLLGAAGGLALALLGARNLMRSFAAYFLCRRAAEAARTVPETVYALVFVVAFGVGPLAGIAAIAIHSAGALGKLWAEVIENVDPGPLDGVRCAGANNLEMIGLAVLPQVIPQIVGYALWRLELNIRAAAIVGFVGAGGIGQELYQAVSLGYYEDVSAIVLLVVLVVATIDIVCDRLRRRAAGPGALP
jgi:phosphonate transport system permease protein